MIQPPGNEPDGDSIATPMHAIDGLLHECVIVGDRTFRIARPGNADTIQDHPAVIALFADHGYMPHWTDLWPAARMLAKAILREDWRPGLAALEIGCGLGLPGIAALACGLKVTFSDCDRTALHFASLNAQSNGFEDFELLPLDWHNPVAERQFPVVLGSDLIYELRNVDPLVGLIRRVLAPDGICLITDENRIPAGVLRAALQEHRLEFTTRVVHASEPGGRRLRGTLYRIRHGIY
jgi:2-polyprenyl-3-methyl-5-hydroxy-6-metoxy-1,4-benzoquinol methylase